MITGCPDHAIHRHIATLLVRVVLPRVSLRPATAAKGALTRVGGVLTRPGRRAPGVGRVRATLSNLPAEETISVVGWVTLVLGVLQILAAFSIWNGGGFGRWFGIAVAGLNAIAR
jgi:hypothetical protein